MDLPIVDKFLCSLSLKAGCIIMGIFNMFANTALAAMLARFAAEIKEGAQNPAKSDPPDPMSSIVYTIEMFMIAILIMKFVLDFVFVLSVIKGVRCVMIRFCVFWSVFLILFSIGFLKTIFHMEPAYVITQVVFMGQNFYYLVIVRSYLISIDEE